MAQYIGLDFETYGAEDLPTHGLARYVRHKTFQPLIAGVSYVNASGFFVDDHVNIVADRRVAREWIGDMIGTHLIVAHNAPFEQAVLEQLDLPYPSHRFIDSAVVARAAGAAGKLEAAAPQLLGVDKMDMGKQLIRLFSLPGKYQEENGSPLFDPRIIEDHPGEWADFNRYCMLDARLGLCIVLEWKDYLGPDEMRNQTVTMDMNRAGWCVDVPLVEEMQRRYLENQALALEEFRVNNGVKLKPDSLEYDLNLNSLPQLKAWCLERGVKANSFDEKNVAKLKVRLEKKLETMRLDDPKLPGYEQVLDLLETKQILGGSSLKKLKVILDTAVDMGDGSYRLFDQYLHCGAGQTYRTSGRSVQMQNLKRLGAEADNVNELLEEVGLRVDWDNEKMARNLRQAFIASHPLGRLIVGDFSSVESRGLAYLAGEDWKLQAYRRGEDLYKVLATKIFPGLAYDAVTKPQRQTGKVGELSCGYGAGAGAVVSFAEGMGIMLEEAEAAKLVNDWRAANPWIVDLWNILNGMLHAIVESGDLYRSLALPDGLGLHVARADTPETLRQQHPGAQSIRVTVLRHGEAWFNRYFHGCYMRGRNVGYYKPSELKSGDLWRNHYTDPKTKQVRFYELYGGKLAGILTQSFCRELFFMVLRNVAAWAESYPDSVAVVGQFHDEIVVDWRPGGRLSLDQAKTQLDQMMSDPGDLTSFPLAAEVKDDYRYTK